MTQSVFEIEMLPGREGDCLLLNYGSERLRRHILIDGGRAATWASLKPRLAQLPQEERHFELLIVTHVDRDHIEGILSMIEEGNRPVTFNDVWFNGYHHLLGGSFEAFGAVQGERLTAALRRLNWHWNGAFNGGAVRIKDDQAVRVSLAGGMELTVVSPDKHQLAELAPRWLEEVMDAGMVIDQPPKVLDVPSGYEALGRNIDIEALADSTFVADSSKPNASSIALVAEFEGRRALLTGDAHVDRLIQSLKPLAEAEGGRLRLDVAKLSHHGSKRNVSSELIRLLACPRYLVSTDGSHFNHPDPEAIARVIKHGGANVELAFNYSTAQTELWGGKRLRDKWGYRAMYPSEQGGYLRISC